MYSDFFQYIIHFSIVRKFRNSEIYIYIIIDNSCLQFLCLIVDIILDAYASVNIKDIYM